MPNRTIIAHYFSKLSSDNGITVSVAFAGLVYTCVVTLGSGSYLDMLSYALSPTPQWVAWGFWAALLICTVIFLVGFAFTLFAYIVYATPIEKLDSSIESDKVYIAWNFFGFISLFILFALISILYVVTKQIPTEWWSGVFLFMSVFLLWAFVLSAALAIILYALDNALQEGWRQYIVVATILFASIFIYAGVYRDTVKSAEITDSKYCYWLSKRLPAEDVRKNPTCSLR